MKREGRQHGVVTCYKILPTNSNSNSLSQQRFLKMVDSSSTMGMFAKVPTKPTNQSKFTGKCRKPRCNGCHIHPVCKSKDKAKGTMKVRSIHAENELTKYSFGTSASGVLAYLADDGGYDYDYDYDYEDRLEENYSYGYNYDYDYDYDHDVDVNGTHDIDLRVGFGIEIATSVAVDEDDEDVDEIDDDDDAMSFCDVGLCYGHEDGDDDDGWYLVGSYME